MAAACFSTPLDEEHLALALALTLPLPPPPPPPTHPLQLGVAGAFALGLTVLHQTVKALLPAKVATPVVGGAWMLGGAYIVFRLTAGTVGGWIGVMERNARRKKNLRRKLEDLEDRLRVMLDTQAVLMGCQPTRGVPEEARGQASRAHSAGSSAELVEAPSTEGEGSPEGSAAGAMSPPTEEMEGWHRYATLARRKQGGGG